MSPELYLAYLIATIVIIVVPGPTVTLIIANSLRHGTRAGLLNVAGGQLGIALMIALVGIGLASLIEAMGVWFDWLRLAGAAYLIWLGWKLIRSPGAIGETGQAAEAARRILPAGISGRSQQPEDAGVLRRVHPAIHRSGTRLRHAGRDHGCDGGRGRVDLRRALRDAGRRRGTDACRRARCAGCRG